MSDEGLPANRRKALVDGKTCLPAFIIFLAQEGRICKQTQRLNPFKGARRNEAASAPEEEGPAP